MKKPCSLFRSHKERNKDGAEMGKVRGVKKDLEKNTDTQKHTFFDPCHFVNFMNNIKMNPVMYLITKQNHCIF